MINYLIACDDLDPKLGDHFSRCEEDFSKFLTENQDLVQDYHKIPILQTNSVYIDIKIDGYADSPFIFIAYTHGNDQEVVCQNNSIVNFDNSKSFRNALVYSTACSTAKKLGPHLVEKGCSAFVGYTQPSIAFLDENYQEMSINCENFALKLWLLNDIEIQDAVNSMKNHFTRQIERLEENGDILYAGDMVSNREALVCLGNSKLRKNEMFVNT